MKTNLLVAGGLKLSAVLALAVAATDARADVSFATFNLVSNNGGQGIGISYDADTFSLYNSGEQVGAVMGRSGYDPFDDMFYEQSYVNGDYTGGVNRAMVSASPVASGAIIDASLTWSDRIFVNQGLADTFYGIRYDHGGGNYSFGWLTIATPGNSLVFVSAGVEQAFGAAIEAGATTSLPIPEPGTAAMWAGLMSVCAAATRRRRAHGAGAAA